MTDQFRFKGFFNFGLLRFLQKIAILFVAYFAVNTLLGQKDTTGVKSQNPIIQIRVNKIPLMWI